MRDLVANEAYSCDDYRAMLEEYEANNPWDSEIPAVRALLLIREQDYENARIEMDKAILKMPANYLNHLDLANICEKCGRYMEALEHAFIAKNLYVQFECHSLQKTVINEISRILSLCEPHITPDQTKAVSHSINMSQTTGRNFPQYRVGDRNNIYLGDYLNAQKSERYNDFIGFCSASHYCQASLTQMSMLMESNLFNSYCLTPIEAIKAEQTCAAQLPANCIVPIVSTQLSQPVVISSQSKSLNAVLGAPNLANYYRFETPASITSEQSFHVGKPVSLSHDPRRKKLVLCIFEDSLSHMLMRGKEKECMPNTMKFFEKGTIFNHSFSTAEWTTPSVPALLSGLFTTRHHIIYYSSAYHLPPQTQTISEVFQQAGYFTARITGSVGCGPYTGGLRGFDRTIFKSMNGFSDRELVGDALEHLKAFSETDCFLMLDLYDIHRPAEDQTGEPLQAPVQQTTALAWETVLERKREKEKTVRQSFSEAAVQKYEEAVKYSDDLLSSVYEYIEEHYQPEDYVVCLYSDHGISFADEQEYLLKENRVSTVSMLCGGGVPQLTSDEYINHFDVMPSLAHFAGLSFGDDAAHDCVLPACHGGKGRACAYTESIYAGQTYKAVLRDGKYEFQLESTANTGIDGAIDFSQGYTVALTDAATGTIVEDQALSDQYETVVYDHVKRNIQY